MLVDGHAKLRALLLDPPSLSQDGRSVCVRLVCVRIQRAAVPTEGADDVLSKARVLSLTSVVDAAVVALIIVVFERATRPSLRDLRRAHLRRRGPWTRGSCGRRQQTHPRGRD